MSSTTRRYTPAVGPKLRRVLGVVLLLSAALGVNSVYLSSVTFLEWAQGDSLQGGLYLWMFLAHLAMGLALILPVLGFGVVHFMGAWDRPNRRAVRAGLALFTAALITLVSGLLLTRLDVWKLEIGLRSAAGREWVYWIHVAAPLAAAWLFVLHRLAGRRIRWGVGLRWAVVAVLLTGGLIAWHYGTDTGPVARPRDGDAYFEPSLARTATGSFIPPRSLLMNEYCKECHPDAHDRWSRSVHAFSSFNNPAYAFSVRQTRLHQAKNSSGVKNSRFCAGCHDPVPFFSGAFEEARWDDHDYDAAHDPLGAAGITCTACHSIVAADGVLGNASFVIEESPQYPFTFSEGAFGQWLNRQLIKAKPAFHARTYMKPAVHRNSEFCSACHKVSLPEVLNDYKWLRGQDHYDSFRLSGASGHGIQAWHWPERAKTGCNECHMVPRGSDDFGAKLRGGERTTLDHQFPSANTAVPVLAEMAGADHAIQAARDFVAGTVRLDIFGLREGDSSDSPLIAPLGSVAASVRPGGEYLLELVTRNAKIAHALTQGTADSNELWLDVTVECDGAVIGRTGGVDEQGAVDPWSKFLTVFALDREGFRIDRRNPEDIFVPLYDWQVPPGAADVTRFSLRVPADAAGPVHISAALRYRKFDTVYLHHFTGRNDPNTLPVLTLAQAECTLPLVTSVDSTSSSSVAGKAPDWERWFDYGIGLFRLDTGGSRRGDLRGARAAFAQVERNQPALGSLGIARVALKEGQLDEAAAALARSGGAYAHAEAAADSLALRVAPPWSIAYFGAQTQRMNGRFIEAAEAYRRILATDFAGARERGFDFSMDDRLLLELAQTLQEAARALRDEDPVQRQSLLAEAEEHCNAALELDPESAASWYVLAQVCGDRGNDVDAKRAMVHYARYKLDENARDSAVSAARGRYPAADHAAEPGAIFSLQRPGAFQESVESFAYPGTAAGGSGG